MIADSFARALFHLAKDPEEWLKELESLTAIFHSRFTSYFDSPLGDEKQKAGILTKALERAIDPKLLHFLVMLLKKKRFSYLPEIKNRFKALLYAKLGIVEGLLMTPFPMDEEMKKNLADKWGMLLDKKILLQEKIDKALIGGGILMFDSRRVDFSLKGKLERLQKFLREG